MIPIKSIMTTNVLTVTPQTPIHEALNILVKNKISGLPVVNDKNEVIGILSEKDVLEILVDKNLHIKKIVGDYMSVNVTCFKEEDNAIDVCKFFIKTPFRRVPIVRDGKLVGIVSRHDIVEYIVEARSMMADFRYA